MNTHIAPTTVPLSSLTLWEGNVRKTDRTAGLSELADNIQANGLINPLTIYFEDDKAFVVAGQRRLLALQLLLKEGRLGEDHPVAVSPIDKAQALQISLAENVIREDMHLADMFVAFDGLSKAGLSPTEIANRFGKAEKEVAKLLKLGRVNPKLLDLFRKDELDLDQVMAFTVTDNQKEQWKVWGNLSKLQTWQRSAGSIRQALTGGEIPMTDKRVLFVGVDAYEAAGGKVRHDLFSERNAGWIIDSEKLETMVAEKLEALRAEVFAEGWKWAEVRESFDWDDRKGFVEEPAKRVPLTAEQKAEQTAMAKERRALQDLDEMTDEQDARYDELTEKLEELEERPTTVARSAMARSGAVIILEHNGKPRVYRGFTLKADMPKQKGQAALESSPESAKSAFSAALSLSLAKEETAAVQAELAANPKLAMAALAYQVLKGHGSGISVNFGKSYHDNDKAKSAVESIAEAATSEAPSAEQDHDDKAMWEWLKTLDYEGLAKIIAVDVARTASTERNGFERLRTDMGVNLRNWFTPAADNYFSKVPKPQIMEDLENMGVSAETISSYASLKKGELAVKAEGHAAEATDWIPKPMRLEQ